MPRKALVIVPTYNEINNIGKLIDEVMKLDDTIHLLIIDDGSPDGTAELVKREQEQYTDRLFLIERSAKRGLGTAYVKGFEHAIRHNYTFICEMDADFSHDPRDLPRLIAKVENAEADVAIGSRYADGISIINWPLSRLILSYSANLYARFITGLPIFDTTAGFKCIHRKVLKDISVKKIRSNGYAFQIELHFRAWKAGYTLKEVAIIFRERKEGVSKMSKSIVWEAIWRVWMLKIKDLLGRL